VIAYSKRFGFSVCECGDSSAIFQRRVTQRAQRGRKIRLVAYTQLLTGSSHRFGCYVVWPEKSFPEEGFCQIRYSVSGKSFSGLFDSNHLAIAIRSCGMHHGKTQAPEITFCKVQQRKNKKMNRGIDHRQQKPDIHHYLTARINAR